MEKDRAAEVSRTLADLVFEMTPAEWSRVKQEIDREYGSAQAKARLTDKEHLASVVESGLSW